MIVGGLVIIGFVCLAAAAVSLFCGRSPQTVVVGDDPVFYNTPRYYSSYNRMGSTMGYGYSPFWGMFGGSRYRTPPPPRQVPTGGGPFFSQQRAVPGNISTGHNAPPPRQVPPPYNAGGFGGGGHTAPPPHMSGGGGGSQRVGFG